MAKVIYSPIVTELNGSIGGMTFQNNGSGSIARLKPKKAKTNTQNQRNQQPRLKEIQSQWQQLSLENKQLWNEFASINKKIGLNGQEKTLTGYQWFLTINQNRALFNDDYLLVPPEYEVVNPINNVNFNFTNDILSFALEPNLNGAQVKCICSCSFILKSISKSNINLGRNIRLFNGSIFNAIWLNNKAIEPFWEDYYNIEFPPNLNNESFYLVGYMRFIGINSGISSLAYTAIARFVWNGSEYVIEEF